LSIGFIIIIGVVSDGSISYSIYILVQNKKRYCFKISVCSSIIVFFLVRLVQVL
jgi:hypothetical protein